MSATHIPNSDSSAFEFERKWVFHAYVTSDTPATCAKAIRNFANNSNNKRTGIKKNGLK